MQREEEGQGRTMRFGIFLFAMTVSVGVPAGALADDPVRAAAHEPALSAPPVSHFFPRPESIEPQVGFWKSVFADYSIHQVVLHDALYLDKVYKVLDFRRYLDDGVEPGEVDRLQRIETDLEVERLRATLLRLHGLGPKPDLEALTAEERRVWDVWKDDPAADRFLAAADEKRLRTQRGLRERFREGVRISRRYLPEMERIFREEGLPVELTRLPLIESCFNLHANSKVGAAGVWQFMPRTGRLFMRVDNLVDERRDPIHSTHAAARFLGDMHDRLGSWPLAITAYNHGPEGIARAVDEVGSSDIGMIVRDYHGRAFGFASRNFYAEFLAATDVERDASKHFGEIPAERPISAREHRLDHAVGIEAAARLARTNKDELAELNPALAQAVVLGRRPIPRGYRLRIPDAGATGFDTRLAEFSAEEDVTRTAAPVIARKPAARARPAVLTARRGRTGRTAQHPKKRRVQMASARTSSRSAKTKRGRAGQVLKSPARDAM